MSVAAHGPGPTPAGGGSGPVVDPVADPRPPGVRPRGGRVCAAPRLARRMDRRPPPRLRALHPERTGPAPREAPAPTPAAPAPDDLSTPAWDAALDAARHQVGPVALRVLAALAEVLDGRRPVGHLVGVCPAETLARVGPRVAAVRRPGGRTRVRGLRLCPLVTTGAHPVLAVEAAAALCSPAGADPSSGTRGRPGPGTGRARAVAARFEMRDDGWRLTDLVLG